MAYRFQELLSSLLGRLVAGTAYGQRRALRQLIKAHTYPMHPAGAQFAGPGWERLQLAIQESQAVLVGEDHGVAQIPLFTAAVAQLLEPALFVAELDPYQAQDLRELVAQHASPAAYLQQHPGALSFYSWRAEFELARQLLDHGVSVLGIDHVFLASSGRFYTRLADLVQNPTTQAYLREQAHVLQAQDRTSLQHNTPEFALFTQPLSTVEHLLDLARQESSKVQKMVQEYATSYHIHQGQLHTGEGHQQRINLMKRNLLRELQRQQAASGLLLPKMLVKLGALHVARNLSPLVKGEYFDVGSLVSNLAEAQDHTSLHIFIAGKQGTKTVGAHPDDPGQNEVSYTAATELGFLQPFLARTRTAWSVTDLRPLRAALLSGSLRPSNQDLQRTVLGYDFLVIIPETTASGSY